MESVSKHKKCLPQPSLPFPLKEERNHFGTLLFHEIDSITLKLTHWLYRSEKKFADILNFLEQVETKSPTTRRRRKKHSESKRKLVESKVTHQEEKSSSSKIKKEEDTFFHGVKKRLVALKVEVANKTRVSELLKKKLRVAEEELTLRKKAFKEDFEKERRESELVLQKQLDFADRLLEDKKR